MKVFMPCFIGGHMKITVLCVGKIKEKYEKVTLALKRLSEIYIDTLSFKIAEGLDVPEIAKIMNISEKLVYTRLERARKLILIELEKMDYEF